ncbi:unnamed protein product [Parnassius apollo]|uniref:(apollo) hypothetical protein n=1 Tax=Parnassius apollo TaxID=110799 RepID=A0A8S3WLF2_PARAO|nr:unnamed protein product [Parnassius apollo]
MIIKVRLFIATGKVLEDKSPSCGENTRSEISNARNKLPCFYVVRRAFRSIHRYLLVKFTTWKTYCCQQRGKTDRDCVPNKIPDDDPVHRFSNIRCVNLTRPESYQSVGCIRNDIVPERILSTTPAFDLSVLYGTTLQSILEKGRLFKGGLRKYKVEKRRIWPPSVKTGSGVCFLNQKPQETRCHSTGHKNLLKDGVLSPTPGFTQISLEFPLVLRWFHTTHEGNMKKGRKLYSNEENIVQCSAVENIENVTLQENQFHSQQLHIYEQRNECITPEVILHRNTGIPGDDPTEDNHNNHVNEIEIDREDRIGENTMDFIDDGTIPVYTNYRKHSTSNINFYKEFTRNSFGHSCIICDRLWWKGDLKKSTSKHESILKTILQNYIPGKIVQVCSTCYTYLEKEKIPLMSTYHGFAYPKIPSHLPTLNLIEQRLISPRIPFMQIRKLRHVNGQYGIYGQIINVPVEVNKMVKQLPRNIEDDHCFYVHLKKEVDSQN